MGLSIWPMLALQIQTVSDATAILSSGAALPLEERHLRALSALLFCVMITAFTILFGSRNLTSRDSHRGLVLALAVESLLELVALMLVGIASVWWVFGGLDTMQEWLAAHPEQLQHLTTATQA